MGKLKLLLLIIILLCLWSDIICLKTEQAFTLTKGVFTLESCSHLMSVFAFASTSLSKFNIALVMAQTQTQNGSEPILSVSICFAIDTMLNFDGDANADVKCEQGSNTWLSMYIVYNSLLLELSSLLSVKVHSQYAFFFCIFVCNLRQTQRLSSVPILCVWRNIS